MDKAQKDTRDMIDVFVEALVGADRVIVETKNALGGMDAHILQAPEILRSWNDRTGDLTPSDEITPQMAAEVLLRHFTSDDCETDFKPAWAAFRKSLWEHDGSIYSAMASFLRALTAIKESKDG